MNDYWQQQKDTPLYEDILWSRPENKQFAGKLLIIGGNKFGFAAPAEAYTVALSAGAGSVRVIMPNALQKLLGSTVPDAYYAPTNVSGSFSKQALDEMLVHASWADYVLIAGELGKNSETAVLLDTFTKKYKGPMCVTKDAVEYFIQSPSEILQRPETCIVLSYEQLQKIGANVKHTTALTFGMPAPAVAQWLHEFSLQYPNNAFVTYHNNQLFTAKSGQVVSQTDSIYTEKIWRVTVAAKASVYCMQNPTRSIESIVTSWL